MPHLQTHKLSLTICLILGFTIAMLTRASFVAFTTDFSYYRIGSFAQSELKEFDETNLGKKVVGVSGFPFRMYSNCVMGYHGTTVSPACNTVSMLWEFSVVLNTIFWGGIAYGMVALAAKISKAGDVAHV